MYRNAPFQGVISPANRLFLTAIEVEITGVFIYTPKP